MESTQQRRITRHRELRACTVCRKRKLKCDLKVPCSSCIRRNEASACVYSKKGFEGSQGGPSRDQNRLSAAERLEHLEQLVQQLSQPQEAPVIVDGGNVFQTGRAGVSQGAVHSGATHWSAMLDDIEELRTVITEYDNINGVRPDFIGTHEDSIDYLLGAKDSSLTFHQILSQLLPPKIKVDRLVGAYFRTKTVAAPFVHTAQFRQYYQSFWANPSNASPLWTSMLFSILDIATRAVSTKSVTDEESSIERYDVAAAQCLVAGDYHRPQKFSVEALLLLVHSKCLAGLDLGSSIAILLGALVRLATVMGYHRDADISGGRFSAFEGEMRRRTWSMLLQIDMLVSFQLGLPSSIQFSTWDTKPPTNLLDSDFDENTLQLPAARPVNELTELLFFIVKHKLVTVFEKVIRHTLSAIDMSNEELEKLDQEIRDTFINLPEVFKARDMADSVVDSPSLIVTRLCVYFIYHKCLCVLHRKYITRGSPKSLQACYESSWELVRRFLDMYKEFEPGGQLETQRWFMGSLTWHDFLLACAALCLTICYSRQGLHELDVTSVVDVPVSLVMLKEAKRVFEEQSSRSKGTGKVQRLIEATILKCDLSNETPTMYYSFQNGQGDVPSTNWHANIPIQENTEIWSSNTPNLTSNSIDDASWTFLYQYLDLPNDEIIL